MPAPNASLIAEKIIMVTAMIPRVLNERQAVSCDA